ncbi:MAG: hypothetical protein WC907_06470 [Acholeplasmataceae bacterium]
MAFNTKTPVSELWAEFINAEPIYYSWYDHNWGIDWNYAEADRCWGCGHIMVSDGGSIECDNCGRELEFEGPMMNYAYPIKFYRADGMQEAALALVDLPLIPVTIDDEEYLALTGGGMDLSWQICEAYMRLSYLPPTRFANLPKMAGDRLDSVHRWVLAGMHRSLLIQKERAERDLKRLKEIRAWLKK